MSALTQLRDSVLRLFTPPLPVSALGAGYSSSSVYAAQTYDPEHALSAMAAYPWAGVAWSAVANDMSSLPVELYDADGKPVARHWFIDLLRRPDPEWSGVRWRRQLCIDYLGSGMAYARIYRTATGRPYRLRRLHPRSMQRLGTEDEGDLIGWLYRGTTRLRPEDVLVFAMPGWRDDVNQEHLGESPVRSLGVSIQAAIDARSQAGKAAKRGRHEVFVSPDGENILGPAGVKQVRDEIEASGRRGDAALVMSHGLRVTQVSMTARDTEWHQLGMDTRDETLARYNVPPVRAQLPSANYGAAKQEMRQYWESGIRPHTELWDAELTELVRAEGLTVRHSFEGVEALQTSYTERLNRVTVWVQLGATPYDAARTEGFREPPLSPDTEPRVDAAKVPARHDLPDDVLDWLTEPEPTNELPWLRRQHVATSETRCDTLASWLDPEDEQHMDWVARALPDVGAKVREDGRSWFVASTAAVDRMGDIVEQTWRLSEWRANPVLLHEHMPQVVGRGEARVVEAADSTKVLLLAATWDDAPVNPLGQLIAHQHRTGMRRAVSVGFIPGQVVPRSELPETDPRYQAGKSWDVGRLYRFNSLTEISSVSVPANAQALQVKAWAAEAEDPAEQLRRLLSETAPQVLRAALTDAMRTRADIRRALLGTIPTGPAPTPKPALPAFLQEG